MSDVLSTTVMMEAFDHRLLTAHRFAIVDVSQREHLSPSWQTKVIAPAFLEQDIGRCPILVDLTSFTPADRDYWLQRCASQVATREPLLFGIFLQTQAETDVVLSHLRRRLVMRLPQREQPLQFRFYDPHTLTQLPRILGDQGLQWLFGPIVAITYAITGHLSRIDKPTIELFNEATPSTTFRLSQEQQHALLRLSAVNRVLMQQPLMNSEVQWRQMSVRADTLIQRAQQQRLSEMDDQIAFALHGLNVHERFDEHPKIRAVLKKLHTCLPDDELDYRELTAAFTEDDWQQIRREQAASTAMLAHRQPYAPCD
jgi:Domain of unknown function (DUF4123)